MKTCISLTTTDCLYLIPYLSLFETEFIREMGYRVKYINESIFDYENYISDYLLLKMVGINTKFIEDDVMYYYNLVDTKKIIEIQTNNETIFKL